MVARSNLQKLLIDKAQYVDQNYLNIPDFVINEDGRPVLKKYEPKQKSEHAEMIENLIRSRLPERNLLDINSLKYSLKILLSLQPI